MLLHCALFVHTSDNRLDGRSAPAPLVPGKRHFIPLCGTLGSSAAGTTSGIRSPAAWAKEVSGADPARALRMNEPEDDGAVLAHQIRGEANRGRRAL